MPKFLEDKLKAEYGANSATPYKVMNAIGAMRGNKETAKGAAMQVQHDRDTARPPLHPALVIHGAKVKAAHAVLSQSPRFRAMPATQRMQAVQHHIRTRMK